MCLVLSCNVKYCLNTNQNKTTEIKMNTIEIKSFQSNLVIIKNGEAHNLDFDNQQGLFSEQDWRDNELKNYTTEEQDSIIDALSNTCNGEFFSARIYYTILKQKNGWQKDKWEEVSSNELKNWVNYYDSIEDAEQELYFISGEGKFDCEYTDEEIEQGFLQEDVWKYMIFKRIIS